MNARVTPAEAALLMPQSMSMAPQMHEALRHQSDVAADRRKALHGLTARLAAAFQALRGGLTELRQRRETIAQLRALSDRELADIGISRGTIPAMVVTKAR